MQDLSISDKYKHIIDDHKRMARRASRKNGTRYQAELNAIAREHGYQTWGAYLQVWEAGSSGKDPTMLTGVPDNRIDMESYASNLAVGILTDTNNLGQSTYGGREKSCLTGLIVAEIIVANNETRRPSMRALRNWLTTDLEESFEQDKRDENDARSEGMIYSGDPHAKLIQALVDEVKHAQPYGRAYVELWRLASMGKQERIHLLMDIIPSLSNYIDTQDSDPDRQVAA